MDITTFDHFTVETTKLPHAPEGRDWGAHHWQFTVTARESGAVHVGVYSVGTLAARRFRSGAASLSESIIQSLGTEAPTAFEGEGDLRKTLEALESEEMGYGLVEGYDVAVNLVNLHDFVEALTDDERDALTEVRNYPMDAEMASQGDINDPAVAEWFRERGINVEED